MVGWGGVVGLSVVDCVLILCGAAGGKMQTKQSVSRKIEGEGMEKFHLYLSNGMVGRIACMSQCAYVCDC